MHANLPVALEDPTLKTPLDRPNLLLPAATLYGLLLAVAFLWSSLRDLELLLFGGAIPASVLLGLGATVALLVFGYVVEAVLPAVRRLAEEMARTLVRGQSVVVLVLVALLSGVSEEVFFRGILQQEFGLVAASVVFGLVHFVPERRFLLWTVYAILAGFFLGWLYEFSGGLAAPIIAHVLNNAVVLVYWRWKFGDSRGDPTD